VPPSPPWTSPSQEGEESYLNMWQKSRDIWKHIAASYLDQFEWFFLLDMFWRTSGARLPGLTPTRSPSCGRQTSN